MRSLEFGPSSPIQVFNFEIKTDFINNMTHEFKTPIATINLALDSIKNPKIINDQDKVLRYIKMIRDENKRMHGQVENVLRISRLEKNQIEINTEATDLHDVIEDTEITKEDIVTEFGADVADMVVALSDPPKVEGGPNRKARKAMDRDRLSKASASVQTIKVADMIDNTESIVAHDPKFAKIYLEEKRLLLDVLTKADASLVDVARNQITIRR